MARRTSGSAERSVDGRSHWRGFWNWMGCVQLQQRAGQWQSLASKAVGQQTKVADAHEASGQHVKEEASQELAGAQSHDALLAAAGIVLVTERDAFPIEGQQTVIGYGDAVGVTAQVAQHLRRPAKSLLGIDDPVLAVKGSQHLGELPGMVESSGRTAAIEQPAAMKVS